MLVEGDGVLRGDQRLSVVIRSGLRYREQVIYLSCDSDQKSTYDTTKHLMEYVNVCDFSTVWRSLPDTQEMLMLLPCGFHQHTETFWIIKHLLANLC